VFRIASDPVVVGLVASGARPAGNLTGVTTLGVEVGPKQLALLHEAVPAATVIALLVNRPTPLLPRPNRESYRQRPARSGCVSMS
jgi:putative ABC transport system substrate-binding protein